MNLSKATTIFLIISLTLLSGFFDARGFFHAAFIWQKGKLVWHELTLSGLNFCLGIISYWVAIKYFKEVGVVFPELQTLIWFVVTIIGVAFLSGQFLHWQKAEQIVALGIILGLGWLSFRTAK